MVKINFTEEEKEIIKFSKDPRLFDNLIQNICPSIYGHHKLKEALILQLFGGVNTSTESKYSPLQPFISSTCINTLKTPADPYLCTT